MTINEVIKELEDLLFSLTVESQINPDSKKVKKRKEAVEIAIESIKVLRTIKNIDEGVVK